MWRTSQSERPSGALIRGILVVGLLLPVVASMALGAEENPPAQGFDRAGSDPAAIRIADEVMAAMGGRETWDQTRYLTWNFFGLRTHVWDKWTGDLRFEQGDVVVLMNLHSQEGRAWKAGETVSDAEETKKLLDRGYRAWINDSYWLLMPYKLKDSGVTLRFKGDAELADGRPADVLELTFSAVGVTPQNKYDVFVGRDTKLVEQWAYYVDAAQEEPAFTTPWSDWQRYGQILLSGDRGELRGRPAQLTEIQVFDDLPAAVFSSPAEIDLAALGASGGH